MNAPKNKLFEFLFVSPIFSSLVVVCAVVGGAMAYVSMPKESAPDLQIPNASVTTVWPGASPESVEKEITLPLERKIKSLKALKSFSSGSLSSTSIISVEFEADAPFEESMQRLRSKVDEAASLFPKEVEDPKIKEVSVSDKPIATLMLYGAIDDVVLAGVADKLRTRLERISGLREAQIDGEQEEIVQIRLIPERLQSLGISPVLIQERLRATNLDVPWGEFENPQFPLNLKFRGRFTTLEQLKSLPITELHGGRVVRLEELAEIVRDLEPAVSRTALSWQGQVFESGVALSLYKSPGRDTVALLETVKAEVQAFSRSSAWPHSLQYQYLSDESDLIWERLSEVFNNGWQAMLAVFVILLLILTWREALVAGLAIPVTVLASLGVLAIMGNTLNELVLVGMVMALGLLADDFILVMEGMHDFLARPKAQLGQAQWNTLRAYAVPSLSGSLTTIAVFIPLMMMGGTNGKFIRMIPVTLAVTLIASYLVSVFVALPLSRHVLRPIASGQAKSGGLTQRLSGSLRDWLLHYAVRNRWCAGLWALAAVAVFVLSLAGVIQLPTELYPKSDGRNLGISVELAPGTTLEESGRLAASLGEVLRAQDFLVSVTRYVGQKSPFTMSSAADRLAPSQASHLIGFSALFIERRHRGQDAWTYVEELREQLEAVLRGAPGAQLAITPETGGAQAGDPIQIEIRGEDLHVLRELSLQVQEALAQTAGATDIRDSLGTWEMEMSFKADRQALGFYDISDSELAQQVRLAISATPMGSFKQPGTQEDLEIQMGYAWPSRGREFGGPVSWEELSMISAFNPQRRKVPLFGVTQLKIEQAPQVIGHSDGHRTVTVMAKTAGQTASQVEKGVRPRLLALQQNWPADYLLSFSGESEASAESNASIVQGLVVAVLLVFVLLALVFGSYKQPLIIMFSVPLALIGTFGGFFLTGMSFSFTAMIGVISLIGIVVNNAIVMIVTMNRLRDDGCPLPVAAARGAADRLRPILSTTMTTLVGLGLLAWTSAMWRPMCLAIIFGLISSTLVSLVVVPCLFLLLPPGEREKDSVQQEQPVR